MKLHNPQLLQIHDLVTSGKFIYQIQAMVNIVQFLDDFDQRIKQLESSDELANKLYPRPYIHVPAVHPDVLKQAKVDEPD